MTTGVQEFENAVYHKYLDPDYAFELLKASALLGHQQAKDCIVWAYDRGWKQQSFEWCLEFFFTNCDRYQLMMLVHRKDFSTIETKLAYRYGYALHVCGANTNARSNLYLFSYQAKSERTKAAIEAWIGVGIRLGLYRDIRRLIGSLIWEDRYYSRPAKVPVFRPNKRSRNGK
jgi:hypothetical protein